MATNGHSKSCSDNGSSNKNNNNNDTTHTAATAKTTNTTTSTSTSTSRRTRIKLMECLLGIAMPLWWTISFQADTSSCRVSRLIASTTVVYGLLYAFLWHCDGFLQPKLSSWLVATTKIKNNNNTNDNNDNATITAAAASEWRSRLLAIANAVVLIFGSILCFTEWSSSYVPESEGWVKTTTMMPLENNSNVDVHDNNDLNFNLDFNCFSSYPVTFASLFVGYLQWDLCWLIWHRDTHPDIGSMIHHTIFISVTHFVLQGFYFQKPFAWLSFTELSTPFLHARWLLAATGKKGDDSASASPNSANKNEASLYFLVSLGFAITFLSTRTVGYGLGLYDVWRSYEFWNEVVGLWGVVVGLHLAYILNLFWSVKVVSALVRAVSKKGKGRQRPSSKKLD